MALFRYSVKCMTCDGKGQWRESDGELVICDWCRRGRREIELQEPEARALFDKLNAELNGITPPEPNKKLIAVGNAVFTIFTRCGHTKPIEESHELVIHTLVRALGQDRWQKATNVRYASSDAEFLAALEEHQIEARSVIMIMAGQGHVAPIEDQSVRTTERVVRNGSSVHHHPECNDSLCSGDC